MRSLDLKELEMKAKHRFGGFHNKDAHTTICKGYATFKYVPYSRRQLTNCKEYVVVMNVGNCKKSQSSRAIELLTDMVESIAASYFDAAGIDKSMMIHVNSADATYCGNNTVKVRLHVVSPEFADDGYPVVEDMLMRAAGNVPESCMTQFKPFKLMAV